MMDPHTLCTAIETLYKLIQVQDISYLLRTNQFDQYVDHTALLLSNANLINSPIYTQFVESIICATCKQKRCQIALDCCHHFCHDCFQGQTHCPICNTSLKNLLDTCLECKTTRTSDKFYYTCKHICVFCGLKQLSQRSNCPKCNCSSILNAVKNFRNNAACQACNTVTIISEDWGSEICKGHFHCYECLKLAWKSLKCRCCQEILDFHSQKVLRKILFSTCSSCNSVMETKFFIQKNCCLDLVCIRCQRSSSDFEKCRNCKKSLPIPVQKRLEKLCD